MAKAAAKKKPSRVRSEDFATSVDRLANDNVLLEALALLAHVTVSKFSDHLPLHRQSEIYARSGLELDRALLAEWMGHLAFRPDPLVRAIGDHVRAGRGLHADDTPVPVLDPGRGKTKTGRLWTLVRDERP